MTISVRAIAKILGAVLVLLFLLSTFNVIAPSERAVKVTLGKVTETVYGPGVHFKFPLFQKFRVYDLAPNTDDLVVDIGQGGAISSDNQIIGSTAKFVWNYDGTKIMDIVKQYPDTSQLAKIVTNTVQEALKAEIGKYTIFQLAQNAAKIASDTRVAAASKLAPYPVLLTQFNLTNWDWSDEFDKRINETIGAQQKVAQAKAEADRAEQEQRAQVIIAEATARSNVATAQGEKEAAELRAAAKRADGQGIADYNKLVAQNPELELKFRQLDIDKIRAGRWNGIEVPTYLPLNPAGGIITLPVPK